MAGAKNIFNADAVEVVREALERANGLPLQHNYVEVALGTLGTDRTLAIILPKPVAGYAPYVEATSLDFPKLDIVQKLPKDMCYSGTWPATFNDFATFMMASYGLKIDPGHWELWHGSVRYPLDGSVIINPDLNVSRQLMLTPTIAHPLFSTAMTFPVFVTEGSTDAGVIALFITGDSEGVVGNNANVQFVVSGGEGPFTFTLVAGIPPVPFNQNGDGLEGVYNTSGEFNYTIQVEDSNGLRAFSSDSIVVGLIPLAITNPAPDTFVNQSYSHQYQFTGGLGPYQVHQVLHLPAGLSISENGLLEGMPDVGIQTIDVQFSDSIANRVTIHDTITVGGRLTSQVRQELRGGLVDWLELGGGYQPLDGPHNHSGSGNWIANDLIFNNVLGLSASGLRIFEGNLEKDFTGLHLSEIAVALWLKRGINRRGSLIFSSMNELNGFQIYVGDSSDSQVRLMLKIDGEVYGFITDVNVEVLTAAPCFIVAQFANGTITLHRNLELIASLSAPITNNNLANNSIFIGSESNLSNAYQWNGTLITAMIFNKRIWGDEMSFLYQNGQGIQYAQLRDNYDAIQESIQSNHLEPVAGEIGTPLYSEILFFGPEQVQAPVLYDGQLPPGMSLTESTGNRWVISGTPTSAGTFASEWGVTADEFYSSQTLIFEISV